MLLEVTKEATNMDWTTIITAVIGVVGGGGLVKLYTQWSQNKKDARDVENEPEVAFRENLIQQVSDLKNELKNMDNRVMQMYEAQLELIKENSELQAQLTVANNHILELKAEIKVLNAK